MTVGLGRNLLFIKWHCKHCCLAILPDDRTLIFASRLITFRVRRSGGELYSGHGHLSVPHHIPTLLHSLDVNWGNGRGFPLAVHCWADLQLVPGFHCYDNIAPNAKCQQVLVLARCLVEFADWFGDSTASHHCIFKHLVHCWFVAILSTLRLICCRWMFACSRLYDIACDAELQEKSKSDLVRVTNLVIDRCRQTVANYEAQTGDDVL